MASIFRRILGSADEQGTWVQADSVMSAKILGYMGRVTDRALVRSTILRRYGTGIKLVKDATTGIDYEVYSKQGFSARMAAGHIETVSVGFGHKLSGAIATLFSEPTQNFDLVGADGTDVSDAAELLEDMRNGEQFIESLVQADNESIWLGSSPVFVEFVDGYLKYHVIDPGKIQCLYEEAIESNGRSRPTNRKDIEDATCVVIETGSQDDLTHSYVAIFGRSSRYPNGRYVTFKSSGDGREIPEFGDDNSWDWTPPDDQQNPANPLSWYANNNPELDLPEYPIAIIYSGLVREDRLFPLSESLLQEALEADVAASHIRATSGDNAKGTLAFSKSDAGGHQPVPKNLRGDVTLEAGQKLESVRMATDGPKVAWELLKDEMTSTGQGFTVPDFHLRSEDYTVEASSGVALNIRSKPLIKFRTRRAAKNAPSVHKIFKVEKALISVFADEAVDEATISLLESCDQTWDPGTQEMPEDEEKVIGSIERCVDLGIYDTIEAIRVKYNLASEDEAIDKYDQLAKRAQKYPPLIDVSDYNDDDNGGMGENDEPKQDPEN